jgi:hypothetical protein
MRRLLAPLALVVLLGAFAVPTAVSAHAQYGPAITCSPTNPVSPETVTITGTGFHAGQTYVVDFLQNGVIYSGFEATPDASGSFVGTTSQYEINYPVGTTDVSARTNKKAIRPNEVASCSFTAS